MRASICGIRSEARVFRSASEDCGDTTRAKGAFVWQATLSRWHERGLSQTKDVLERLSPQRLPARAYTQCSETKTRKVTVTGHGKDLKLTDVAETGRLTRTHLGATRPNNAAKLSASTNLLRTIYTTTTTKTATSTIIATLQNNTTSKTNNTTAKTATNATNATTSEPWLPDLDVKQLS